jgi:hypothetical protein
MLGNRQTSEAKLTRMSLAQFSKNLASGESHARPECASSATEGFRQESAGQKRFATDVVAAMSNPAPKSNEEVAELPERQFTTGKSEGS